MTFWRRRKPVDLVGSQIETSGQWEKPSEVDFVDTLIEAMNANITEGARSRVPLRDKITMTIIKG
jgi:hypothetical protein